MTRRPKILLLGYLPPPHFGPSVAYNALLHSSFAEQFDVTFLDITVSRRLQHIERFHPGKLLKLAGFLLRETWWLATRRFALYCAPIAANRNAFLKDALLAALARCFRLPIVLYAHGNGFADFYAASPRWLQRIASRTLRNAAAVIVVGDALRFNFQPHLPDEKIFSVHYGAEPSPIPLHEKQPCPGPLTVLYLGNLIREKGVFVLLQAIPMVLAKNPHIRFRLAGAWWSDQDRQQAERFIRQAGLEHCIELPGPLTGEAKWRALAEADMFVFPTHYRYESFGIVLVEAMQAGLPVIATRRAAIPEIIQDGVNGLFCEEQNPADLAEKILRLAADPELRQRIGRANRQRFHAYYTQEHFAQRFSAAVHAILENIAHGR